ncbi:MAG TPA: hypothetical protein VJO32_06425 [Ktedonobacteraceae bacterium]|nr:hypothetical protein [Ktedonobacteraceae bacterium]
MAQEQLDPLPSASYAQQEDTSVAGNHIPDSVKNFDEIAKQMISMESLMVALYFGAFTFTKLNPGWGLQLIFYLLPLFFILVSVYSALNVFFPTGYLSIDHVGFRQAKIEDIVRHKLVWFRIASISFVLSILCFLLALLVYLIR